MNPIKTAAKLLFCLIVVGVFAGRTPADTLGINPTRTQRINAYIRRLAKSKATTIAGGHPSRPSGKFYRLSRLLLKYGRAKTFDRLIHHRNPVCRIAGVYCLTKKNPKKALRVLQYLRFSTVTVNVEQHTCCLSFNHTEGMIARSFLDNANFLDIGLPSRKLSESTK